MCKLAKYEYEKKFRTLGIEEPSKTKDDARNWTVNGGNEQIMMERRGEERSSMQLAVLFSTRAPL
jgi:hypothetical protein